MALQFSLPSPPTNAIELGPVRLTAYGFLIALGVMGAVWLAGRRLERFGGGSRDDLSHVAVWAVLGGLIGARLYHVATSWSSFEGDLDRIPMLWKGGLGIPGGLAVGTAAGLIAARRRGINVPILLSAAAPAVALAQSIGRWGNWWNQELFGRPTSLPWGLEIAPDKLPPGYTPNTVFHPTFLYESLWNLAVVGALLLLERRVRLRPGRLFVLYLAAYFSGRFWIEGLRIDPAHNIGGLRVNQWVALAAVGASIAFLLVDRRRGLIDVKEAPHNVDTVDASPDRDPSATAPSARFDQGLRPTASVDARTVTTKVIEDLGLYDNSS